MRMWSDALDMMARAERLHRQLFEPRSPQGRAPVWEPPVDVIETSKEVLILTALPGVDPDRIEATIQEGMLVIAGHRLLPAELRTAIIHRLELPQGEFLRKVELPSGVYRSVSHDFVNGCLVIRLGKTN
jgi:HSP20 family protein